MFHRRPTGYLCLLAATAALLAPPAARAQLTTGLISGRLVDQQGAALPGALVSATSVATGLTRMSVSDENGLYRLAALPVGDYDVAAELSGFTRLEQSPVPVDVSRTTTLDLTMQLAGVRETVTVVGQVPLSSVSSSSVGEVVDLRRIESLPLNGRQFANLAATVPGVGLGFHSDLTKSTQYTPQIGGGNGRNINYIVDGGDNNDDTVGGLLQLYPLEAVQEFTLSTGRFQAETGRSDGATLNVVTKSGTNQTRGSWFTLLRDDALNARTFTEQLTRIPKQDYRRYQFGGSLGGPLVRNHAHYFAAYERTQQDTRQAVNTLGLFPAEDGVYATPVREGLLSAKVTSSPSPGQYVAVRYARNTNDQPNGAALRAARSVWSTSRNHFNSTNANHNWVFGASHLNEAVVQYATFTNAIPASSSAPYLLFPNGVTAGANPAAPQATEQTKWQFRDDLTWTITGLGGLGHTIKAGVNWIHEPRLFISTTSGSSGQFTMAANDLNAPVQLVSVIGGAGAANIPLEQTGLYVQDDWRAAPNLTVNLGVRYDYVAGMPIDQSRNPNFLAMQAAGRNGRFAGTVLDDFGRTPQGDTNNIQPRFGAVLDLHGDGRDVVRGGWGVYTDFAYTNANALTAALDAAGGIGLVFLAQNPAGLRKPDGTLFRATDPLSSIAGLNLVNTNIPPLAGEVVSPRLQQPFAYQWNLGWSHQVGATTVVSADYLRVDGRDQNLRLRPNAVVNGRLVLTDVGLATNIPTFRTAVSRGTSLYDGLTLALRHRMSHGFDLNGSYTLSRATSNVGSASDEVAQNLIQDVRDPLGPVQDAPSARVDGRHRVSVSAIIQAPWRLQVAPVLFYRSALPVHTCEGIDLNADGNVNDRTPLAYRYTGLNTDGTARFTEDGTCATVNCSRRAPFSQLNLRVSRAFALAGPARIEAIAEVFNVFDARNPFIPLTTRRRNAGGTSLASFMQPTAFAGDFQQPEQRIGQIGFRLTF